MIDIRPIDIERFWGRVDKSAPDSCWLWVGRKDRWGYGVSYANGITISAHRMAYTVEKGVIPEGLCVCHSCDVPACCNPEHLWVGTVAENNADMIRKNRNKRPYKGTAIRRVRRKLTQKGLVLTAEQVREIRSTYKRGEMGYKRLAKQYGVNRATIQNVVLRRLWKHVE